MDEILINIIPFKDKPFSKPIKIWKYTAKTKFNWSETGWKVRQIRRRLRNSKAKSIVFQHGDSIISNWDLLNSKAASSVLKDFIKDNVQFSINTKSHKNLELLQKLLGEAFSDKLRKLTEHAYKVVEKSNAVYYAIPPLKIADFNEIEIWPGFQYSPLIKENGAAGMIIDPRSQYHTKQTLREIYDKNFDSSKELDFYHTDTCPIDCLEKRDPLSTCLLSGSGLSIKIADFIPKSPSEIFVDENKQVNLINYNNMEKVCPRKMLGDYLEDKPPLILANFGYHYPLERIRRSPYSSLIKNENDRRKLQQLVALNPLQRYRRTANVYAPLLDILRINENLILNSTGELISQSKGDPFTVKSGQFTPSKLYLKDKRSFYPIRDLMENGPYQKPNIEEIKAVIINIGSHEKISEFNDLFSGLLSGLIDNENKKEWNIDERFCNKISFPSFLKMNLSVIDILKINNTKDLDTLKSQFLTLKKNHGNNLLVFLCIGSNSKGLIIPIKRFLTINKIPNQGLNISTFIEKMGYQQISYFQNIILGGFCKISGVPWAIDSKKPVVYIGYNSTFQDKDKIIYSLASFDSKGIWLKGSFSKIDRKDFVIQLKSDLNYLLSERNEEDIRFYVNGILTEISEFPVIEDCLNDIGKKYAILEIINNPLRIYNVSEKGWYSANRGSYMKILPKQICLVTTFVGKQGTPNPILIKLRKGNIDLFEEYIEEIFLLTQAYPGYVRLNTRYPSPVHAARTILSDSNSLELTSLAFDIPWFI